MHRAREKKNLFFFSTSSFALVCIHNSFLPLIMTWNIDRQQHFHLFYRSCYLQYAYVWLLFLLRLNDFEYHRRLPLSIERKANKQNWILITVRETFYYPFLYHAIIYLPTHFSHNCNKSSSFSPPLFFLSFFSDLWSRT